MRLLLEYRLTAHEICRLMVCQVDGSAVTVEGKHGQSREVELEGAAVVEIGELLRSHPGGELFTGPSGPLRPDALRRLLTAASAAAGVGGQISIHRNTRVADVQA